MDGDLRPLEQLPPRQASEVKRSNLDEQGQIWLLRRPPDEVLQAGVDTAAGALLYYRPYTAAAQAAHAVGSSRTRPPRGR